MTEFKFKHKESKTNLTKEEKIDMLLDDESCPKTKPMFLYVDGLLVIPMPGNRYLWFFDHGCHQYWGAAESKALMLGADKIYQSGYVMHDF